MPNEIDTELDKGSPQLISSNGTPTEKSLFAPVYQADFNPDEAEFACYLDKRSALQWWHRNVAKAGNYHLQGWRKHKVYLDFIFALTNEGGHKRLAVLETKGDQLEGNLDTTYKRKLLKLLSESYRFQQVTKAGELELILDK